MIVKASSHLRLSAKADCWWIKCLDCHRLSMLLLREQLLSAGNSDIRLVCKRCCAGHFVILTQPRGRVLHLNVLLDVRDGSAYPEEMDQPIVIQEYFPP